jgi:hypothetical protein
LHFNYDLIISIEIRSTVQHAGALAAAWIPPSYYIDEDNPTFNDGYSYPSPWFTNNDQFWSNYYPQILDQQQNKTYEFKMPLKSIYDKWYVRPSSYSLRNINLGTFAVFVYSPLNTTTAVTSLPVVVRYRLENVEFDTPTYQTPT